MVVGVLGLVGVLLFCAPAMLGVSQWTYVHAIVVVLLGGLGAYLITLAFMGNVI